MLASYDLEHSPPKRVPLIHTSHSVDKRRHDQHDQELSFGTFKTRVAGKSAQTLKAINVFDPVEWIPSLNNPTSAELNQENRGLHDIVSHIWPLDDHPRCTKGLEDSLKAAGLEPVYYT